MTLLEFGMISLTFFCSLFFVMILFQIYSPKPRMQVFWPVALSTIRTTGKPYSMGGLFIRHSETKSTVFELFCVHTYAVKYTYGRSTMFEQHLGTFLLIGYYETEGRLLFTLCSVYLVT